MTRSDLINHIGRQIGEALNIPYAFRVEQDQDHMHISFDELDAASAKLGKVKMRKIIDTVNFEVTDKGLAWNI